MTSCPLNQSTLNEITFPYTVTHADIPPHPHTHTQTHTHTHTQTHTHTHIYIHIHTYTLYLEYFLEVVVGDRCERMYSTEGHLHRQVNLNSSKLNQKEDY